MLDRLHQRQKDFAMHNELELSIVIPCLNEAETIAVCVIKALDYLRSRCIIGEVLVADNGSTDGSIEIASSHGARVLSVPVRGYGAALWHGIGHAQGRYVIMGDADDSYDFLGLDPFVERLRAGDHLVVGNRFKGGIAEDAMPMLHRYLGNPVLSFLGRLFFKAPLGDFHCGLRGFDRKVMLALNLQSPGMEFASEMIVKAQLAKLIIAEVPTTLKKDGRSRPPHLRTWRDGWRHLRFLLLHSPTWLFLVPGVLLFFFGLVLSLLLQSGPVHLGVSLTLDIHSLVMGCLFMLAGFLSMSFAFVSRRYAELIGFLPEKQRIYRWMDSVSLERMLIISGVLIGIGLAGVVTNFFAWAEVDFKALVYASLLRPLLFFGTIGLIGAQLFFTAFLLELISLGSSRRGI